VSIIGTFIGMHLLGFSINMLTLFGMILAIGLVVDDAIVVVENVEANMTKHGLSALEASKKAMTEIAGALISIVLVLVAVFLPVAFLGGVTGTLYQQFAITIAISMVISGTMALTLSPALAAIILKVHHGEKRGFFRWFENGFQALTRGYVGVVARMIQGWPIALLAFGGVIAGILFMFRILPGSFVPEEDQGYFFILVEAPDTASQGYVAALLDRTRKIVAAEGAVQDIATVNGYSLVDSQQRNNAAVMFVSLKPFEERKDASQLSFSVLPRLNKQFAALKEGFVFAINPPSVPGLGTTGGFELYAQNRGAGDPRATNAAVQKFLAEARQRPELAGVNTTFRANTSSCSWNSTATRRKCWACRCRMCSRRCRPSSARRSPASSRSSAGSGGSSCRPTGSTGQSRCLRQGLRPLHRRQHGAAVGADPGPLRRCTEVARALQRLSGGEAHRQSGAGLQFRPGARRHGGRRAGDPAGRLRLCVGRAGVAGKGIRWHLCHRVHRGPGGRVPVARGAVREVDHPRRRAPHRAGRDSRCAAAHLGSRPGQRRLFPGGSRHPRGPVGQETPILICEFAMERVHAGLSAREAALEAAGLRCARS